MNVHRTAQRGFQEGAGAYERGRPHYPAEAIEWLVAETGLGAGRVVVDVGAGTGKLTRALVSSGAEVLAVEPVSAMRAVLQRAAPSVRLLDGAAENLPLPDASVDLITVAQAFHWFEGPRALAEFHRVLRPAGQLVLVWNRRIAEQPVWCSMGEITEPYRGDTPAHATGAWRAAFTESSLFVSAGEFTRAWEQDADIEQLIDRVLSTSFLAALPDGERDAVSDRLRQALAGAPEPLSLGYVCEALLFERTICGMR